MKKAVTASDEPAKRLTANDWNDVADLCQQFLANCEMDYEEHTVQARKKAAEWMKKMSERATDNCMRLEAKQCTSRSASSEK